jgi:hypothetical protein
MIKYHYQVDFDFSNEYLLELEDYNREENTKKIAFWKGWMTNENIKDLYEIGCDTEPEKLCRDSDDYGTIDDFNEFTNHALTATKCYGVAANEEEFVCSGHGQCIRKDHCECDCDGYYGAMCEQTKDPLWVGWSTCPCWPICP